jgi:hypothetical protein
MNPVVWYEVYVDDLARARAFYETVLDTSLSPLDNPNDGMEMLQIPGGHGPEGGAGGALVRMDGVPVGGNSTMVYFSVPDCGVAAARVEEAGGRLCRDKFSIGEHGFIALVYDTEGNMIGLHSER